MFCVEFRPPFAFDPKTIETTSDEIRDTIFRMYFARNRNYVNLPDYEWPEETIPRVNFPTFRPFFVLKFFISRGTLLSRRRECRFLGAIRFKNIVK